MRLIISAILLLFSTFLFYASDNQPRGVTELIEIPEYTVHSIKADEFSAAIADNPVIDIETRFWVRPYAFVTQVRPEIIVAPHLLMDYVLEDGTVLSDTISRDDEYPNGDGTFCHPGSVLLSWLSTPSTGRHHPYNGVLVPDQFQKIILREEERKEIEGTCDGTITDPTWYVKDKCIIQCDGDSMARQNLWVEFSNFSRDSKFHQPYVSQPGIHQSGGSDRDEFVKYYFANGVSDLANLFCIREKDIERGESFMSWHTLGGTSIYASMVEFRQGGDGEITRCCDYGSIYHTMRYFNLRQSVFSSIYALPFFVMDGDLYIPEDEDLCEVSVLKAEWTDVPHTDEFVVVRNLKIDLNIRTNRVLFGNVSLDYTYQVTMPTDPDNIEEVRKYGWLD